MTKLFLLVAVVITGDCVKAQITERIIVKAGEDIGNAISPTGHYRFAEFTEGTVTMRYGSKSKTRFNYHICNGEMQFIDAKGDTLTISQTEYIDNINIGGNTRTVALSYDVEVRKTTSYYWIDSDFNAIPTTKKNSLKLVGKDKQAKLQAFMDDNKIDFDNEEDLRKLLEFAARL